MSRMGQCAKDFKSIIVSPHNKQHEKINIEFFELRMYTLDLFTRIEMW
jgi:hypothetical protein